jgi:uncharacterized Zn finger protein (UPF0148 family)
MTGAKLDIFVYDGDKRLLRSWYEEQYIQAVTKHGKNRVGKINALEPGLVIQDQKLTNKDEAIKYIGQYHEKKRPAIAVSFAVPNEETGARKKWRYRLDEREARLADMQINYLVMLKNTKRERITCRKCTSMLARQWLTSLYCPVCKAFVMATSYEAKINKVNKEIDELRETFKKTFEKTDVGCRYHWLVGGWCPSGEIDDVEKKEEVPASGV